jgi:hypothetical protein
MKTKVGLFFISVMLFASTAYAQAPSWSDAQSEVWTYVQQSWVDDAAENRKWPAEYAHEKFVTWGDDRIAPRDRETTIRWEHSSNAVADTFWYEITPLAIIVEGETAVVMYALLEGQESKDGERELTPSSVVEVLSRENRTWKFLASTTFTPRIGN